MYEPNYSWRTAATAFLLIVCLVVVAALVALIFVEALPDPLPYRDPEPHVTSE